MSILGVGHIVWQEGVWRCYISTTARRYLIGAEPNVEAFCRLQLGLYQRPDGRGQQYNRNRPSLEHQSQSKTLSLINNGYKVCPLRLILKIFEAKARLQGWLQDEIFVTPEEIYTLVNCQELRGNTLPSTQEVTEALEKYYSFQLPIVEGEKRFAFLEATGLFEVERSNNLRLLNYGDIVLNYNRDIQIEAIKSLDCFFEDFNQGTDINHVYDVLASGNWANYFDACKTLSAEAVVKIAGEIIVSPTLTMSVQPVESTTSVQLSLLPQPRKIEREYKIFSTQRKQPQSTSNPEITRILRERRNAWHDLLVQKMKECIEKAGLEPWETDLIDVGVNLDETSQLYPRGFPIQNTYLERQKLPYFESESPESLTFIFEMKSSDVSIIIDQVRKAVSQL